MLYRLAHALAALRQRVGSLFTALPAWRTPAEPAHPQPGDTFTLANGLHAGGGVPQTLSGRTYQVRHPGGGYLPTCAVVKVQQVDTASRTLLIAPVLLPHLPAWA